MLARVSELLEVMDELDAASANEGGGIVGGNSTLTIQDASKGIALRGVSIVTPGGLCVAQDLSFKMCPNEGLMLTGPMACGKSSIVRVLRGSWPLLSGELRRPPARQIFLIPQRIHMCAGSLYDQVCSNSTTTSGRLLFDNYRL
eukprot:SAG31_NODE_770_length_12217_cov_2.855174_6_plen_144_part_00